MNLFNSNYFLFRRNVKIQKVMMFFALLMPASFSLADLQACEVYFASGIHAHGPGNFVRFGYNAQLLNNYGWVNSDKVINHKWSIKESCFFLKDCAKSGSDYVDMSPTIKLETTATNQLIVPPDKKLTIGTNNVVQYGKVVASERSVVTFKQQSTPYVINQLEVGYKSKLRLPAGEYWVKKLTLEVEGRIDVVGDGQVSLYVIDSFSVPLNFRFNDDTKNPAKMAISTFGESNFYTGSRTYAFVRSEGRINLGYHSMIVGGLLGHYVELEPESQVAYDIAASRSVQFNNFCKASPNPLDLDSPVVIFTQLNDYTEADHALLTGTIIDSGENASGVALVNMLVRGKWVPIQMDGNNFSIDLPLDEETNMFTILVYDRAGNEAFIPFYAYRIFPGQEQ